MAQPARGHQQRRAPAAGNCRSAARPSISVSAPPASCTKRSAAARSQSWLLPLTMVMSTSPCATRASRSASEPTRGSATDGCEFRQRAEEALGAGNLVPSSSGAAAGLDRDAVAGRALARHREEEFVRHRRIERRQPRPAGRRQRDRDHPVLAAVEIGARAVDRIDDPDRVGFCSRADRPRSPPTASHRRGTRRELLAAAHRPRYRPR